MSSPVPAAAAFSRSSWIVLAIALALVWFANLDQRKLQHPDEGRYAEIAREMQASGDWVTPHLNGLKYFEKPPLQYWLTAASLAAFGHNEWAARLPAALAGFLTVLLVGYAGALVASSTTGVYAAAALASSTWQFGISHILTLDALLTFWLTLALAAFLLAQRADSSASQRRWMLVAWAATAGGVLTKGLVALVIPFCTLFLYSLSTRDVAPWKRLHLGLGVPLLIALAGPWFVVVSMRNPEFARFFFIHEHFERFLTTEHRRTGAWWYFLPMLAAGLLPWTGIFAWRAWGSWRRASVDAGGFAWARFCLLWSAFVLFFFSLSGSKLPSYILPIFPATALVIGRQLEEVPSRTLVALVGLLVASTVALWLGALLGWPRLAAALADEHTPRALYDALGPWVKLGFGIAAFGYSLGFVAFRRGTPAARTRGVVALAFATMVSMQAFFAGSDVFRATRSAADLVATLENAADPPYDRSAPFFQVRMYDQTLPFYLGRTTTLVQYRDEMSLGLDADPGRGIARVADWISRWQSLSQGYALMSPETRASLRAEGVPMRDIASDSRRVLVARR